MTITTQVPLLKNRRTKIVATLGPASGDVATVTRLVAAGVNAFRLNMSHGDHDGHRAVLARVRDAARAAGRHVAVLADLAGPKIRVGRFAGGSIELHEGAEVVVTVRDVEGGPGLIPSQYAALAGDVGAGDRILLADGALELSVESVAGTEIRCRVSQGGTLGDRKGINLPGVAVSAPCLTDKDRADARFMLGLGVDYLGLSFVRSAADVAVLQALIAGSGQRAGVVAKIERPEALTETDGIVAASDAIMVARGDLGVELPPEQVPIAQAQLIDHARRAGKPVIVATQMLESMIENARPTRAEVADVAGAVFAGADAVMLSGETASGAFPVQTVQMMDSIARQTEGYQWQQGAFDISGHIDRGEPPIPFGDAMARCTAQLSRDLRVHAIVVISRGGMSAATLCAGRPAAPVVALSPSPQACRRMSLMWGAIPLEVEPAALDDAPALARRIACDLDLAAPGDYILMVRGFHVDPVLNTPSVTLLQV
jgi:pyruvate kinase